MRMNFKNLVQEKIIMDNNGVSMSTTFNGEFHNHFLQTML